MQKIFYKYRDYYDENSKRALFDFELFIDKIWIRYGYIYKNLLFLYR